MAELTDAEVKEIKDAVRELREARKAEDRAPEGSAQEAIAERRVETKEEKLRRIARETGVSYETLQRAADEEEQAEFERRLARVEEKRAAEAKPPEGDPDPEADPPADPPKDPPADPDENDPTKGLKKPPKKKDPTPEQGPEVSHWAERPLFSRKAKAS